MVKGGVSASPKTSDDEIRDAREYGYKMGLRDMALHAAITALGSRGENVAFIAEMLDLRAESGFDNSMYAQFINRNQPQQPPARAPAPQQ